MFDIGFSELVLIAIVGLVVFGPEELPRVARTVGLLLGRLRRYVADVKSDISREMEASEMKSLVADVKDSANAFQRSINEQADAFKAEFNDIAALPEETKASLAHAIEPVNEAFQSAVEAVSPDAELAPALSEPEVRAVESPAAIESAGTSGQDVAGDENQLDLFGEPEVIRKENKE